MAPSAVSSRRSESSCRFLFRSGVVMSRGELDVKASLRDTDEGNDSLRFNLSRRVRESGRGPSLLGSTVRSSAVSFGGGISSYPDAAEAGAGAVVSTNADDAAVCSVGCTILDETGGSKELLVVVVVVWPARSIDSLGGLVWS